MLQSAEAELFYIIEKAQKRGAVKNQLFAYLRLYGLFYSAIYFYTLIYIRDFKFQLKAG